MMKKRGLCALWLMAAWAGTSAMATHAADPVAASSGSYSLPAGLAPVLVDADNTNVATASAAPPVQAAPQGQRPATDAAAEAAMVQADGTQALPSLNQAVVDQAGLLSAAERQALEQKLRAIHNAGRAQMGLLIVPTTGAEPIFDYATRAFSQWKLGDAQRDNGLLIVLARNDRKIQILTGYGLEGVLPDVVVKQIISNQITPAFKAGDYAGGLNAGIDRMDQILQQDPETAKAAAEQARQQAAQDGQGDPLGNGITILIIMLVLGQVATWILGRFFGALAGGAVGGMWAMYTGIGLLSSLVLGGLLFFLLLTGILSLFGGRGGFGGGGFGGGGFGGGGFGGGGYAGGGGSFGGGGASGSW